MKSINLITFANYIERISPDYNKVCLEAIYHNKLSKKIDTMELESIVILKNHLFSGDDICFNDLEMGEGFFWGYTIPQISKEFDLLRIGDNYIINIELKSHDVDYNKKKEQLIKNQYYLKFINNTIKSFSYIADEKKLYFLDDGELTEKPIDFLKDCIKNQEYNKIDNLDTIFNPHNYIISPFNNVDKFINDEYFLTNHQEEQKNCLLKSFDEKKIFSIIGSPGTGKTLLLYDLVKHFRNIERFDDSEICVIHCGYLNTGHEELNKKGFNIFSIKDLKDISFFTDKETKLIFVDEIQRIRLNQLEIIQEYLETNNSKAIFSLDPHQTLSKIETQNDICDYLENTLHSKILRLSGKVRTNKELSHFINGLCDSSKRDSTINYQNVNIIYLDRYEELRLYIDYLTTIKEYTFINYTGLKKFGNDMDNAHKVIGQEFDKVAVVIDDTFYYKKEKDKKILHSEGWKNFSYTAINMFYQIITRAKKELTIIVYNNKEMFAEISKIISDNLN